jgi:3'(2'), 5'-bisphosphate nucleotidase
MENDKLKGLLDEVINICIHSSNIILDIYNSDFKAHIKSDLSPVTIADKKTNDYIVNELRKFGFPILSEESKITPFQERIQWDYCWIVDPLDGTKEFINRNGEFTINIALVQHGEPILGVVYSPIKKWLYVGDKINGSFKWDYTTVEPTRVKLPSLYQRDSLVVVASKSHLNQETVEYVKELEKEYDKPIEFISMGSSLKLCLVAEGMADFYPRLAPTMEWDTAAAHAVVKYAGGKVVDFGTQKELIYNKENLLNPSFVVSGI